MAIRKGNPEPVDDPDVAIGARVKAKRLRFRKEPKTKVELRGGASTPEGRTDLRASSGSERENLPQEVEPDVTYRDVRVGWQASARLEDPGADAQSGQDQNSERERTDRRDEEQGQR
jgi:hypothetical protein